MSLRTSDGVRIAAAHDPGPAGLAIVLAHGFTGTWRRPATRRAAGVFNERAGVVSFDFRGHGRSGGRSTVGDLEVLDVEAAVAWARELGYAQVATVGFSMGASIVVRHAGLHNGVRSDIHSGLSAVAAVSGPSRWYYRGTVPMRRVHWIIERRLGRLVSRVAFGTRIVSSGWTVVPAAPDELVGHISPVPLLIVHGDADHYFPVEHGERLYAAAKEPKEFWLEPGYGHAETAATPELLARIRDWVVKAVHSGQD
jgi:pimeloyl-ACP methyl ester carboxylesterase